jgi:hypothetical protein
MNIIKFIIFIILGIIIFFILNKGDGFNIGVPWCLANIDESILDQEFVYGVNMYQNDQFVPAYYDATEPNKKLYWCDEYTKEVIDPQTGRRSIIGIPDLEGCLSPYHHALGYLESESGDLTDNDMLLKKYNVNSLSYPIRPSDNTLLVYLDAELPDFSREIDINNLRDNGRLVEYDDQVKTKCKPGSDESEDVTLTCRKRKSIVLSGFHTGLRDAAKIEDVTIVPDNMQFIAYVNTFNCYSSYPGTNIDIIAGLLGLMDEDDHPSASQRNVALDKILRNNRYDIRRFVKDPGSYDDDNGAIVDGKKFYIECNARSRLKEFDHKMSDGYFYRYMPYESTDLTVDVQYDEYKFVYHMYYNGSLKHVNEETITVILNNLETMFSIKELCMGPYTSRLSIIYDENAGGMLDKLRGKLGEHGDLDEYMYDYIFNTERYVRSDSTEWMFNGIEEQWRNAVKIEITYTVDAIQMFEDDINAVLKECCVPIQRRKLRASFFYDESIPDTSQGMIHKVQLIDRERRLFGRSTHTYTRIDDESFTFQEQPVPPNASCNLPIFCANTYLNAVFRNPTGDLSLEQQLSGAAEEDRYTSGDIIDVMKDIHIQMIRKNPNGVRYLDGDELGYYGEYLRLVKNYYSLNDRDAESLLRKIYPTNQTTATPPVQHWRQEAENTVEYIGHKLHEVIWEKYGYGGEAHFHDFSKMSLNLMLVLIKLFKQSNDQVDFHYLSCMYDTNTVTPISTYNATPSVAKLDYYWEYDRKGKFPDDEMIGPLCEPRDCDDIDSIVKGQLTGKDPQRRVVEASEYQKAPYHTSGYRRDGRFLISNPSEGIHGGTVDVICDDDTDRATIRCDATGSYQSSIDDLNMCPEKTTLAGTPVSVVKNYFCAAGVKVR